MAFRLPGYRVVGWVFAVLAVLALVIWSMVPGYVVGWDLRVYGNAIASVQAGHDPYADGIAVQRAYHALEPHAPGSSPPFTYVYSPITLPLIHLAAALPTAVAAGFYWLLYVAASFAALWVGMQFVLASERKVFWLLAPAAIFFPGLLQNDVFFSGNIACILYGLALVAAVAGWRRGQWGYFYAAVLLASCFKAPLLSLLAIPVLSARGQWRPALLTGGAGLALFALQPLVWPALFHHYLEAVELQFSFNHDFSSSPAGLLADALYDVIPYRITSTGFYLFYAAGFFALLYMLSRRFLAGRIPLERWVPVLVVGTLLLNPRIMEYDVAPITLLMALIVWRFLIRGTNVWRSAIVGMALFGALNGAAHNGPNSQTWRPTECLILVGVFGLGMLDLFTLDQNRPGVAPVDEVEAEPLPEPVGARG